MVTIYIHGFGSSGQSDKPSAFRKHFKSKDKKFISPSLSYIPDLAISTLEELIESYDRKVQLIGSSLGGYYTIYLSNKYNIKGVLLNPAVKPKQTLQKILQDDPDYYAHLTFRLIPEYIDMLKSYKVEVPKEQNLFLMLQKGDELLDYKEALEYLPSTKLLLEEQGNHRFDGIEKHFDLIDEFLD